MKNLTMNINSIPVPTQAPMQPPQPSLSYKISAVSFSVQFDNETDAINFAQYILHNIINYDNENEK